MASPAAADPHVGFVVTVADLASTSAAFARRQDVATAATRTASGALARTAGMAGDDPVLAQWRGRYDAVASITWLATGAVGSSLHGVAVLLVDTADAYLAAEHASSPRRRGGPETLPRPPDLARLPAGPPAATGRTGNEAPPDLAEYWPGGDPARLRAAATAWSELAEHLDDAAYAADRAFRTLIDHNRGATFSAMGEYWARRFRPDGFDPLYNAVPRTARILGQVCGDLAELIEQARLDMEDAVSDALHDTAGSEVVARLPLGPVTAAASRVIALLAPPVVASGYVLIARDRYLTGLHELTISLGPDLEDRLRRALTTELPPGRDPRADLQTGVRAADVGEVLRTGLQGSGWDGVGGFHPGPDQIHVVEQRVVHILDGDATGGGHRSGAGRPGKTEFPPGWSDRKIIDAVLSVARDPDTHLEQDDETGENVEVEGVRDGVLIRVFVGPGGFVSTGHPVSGPGVITNPLLTGN